ncbi:MAG: 6,7-dimethyl-8-ribityllumazine synthase [Kiritimatiellae bacterium]|nr:6,7-dimethyl-8-ribityllumazine synthase [Kiritimatiellia bacterium]MBR4945421.1 6,7-dimethyl-8-ribityllumazine synthase [Kiritimatiellia bacterium]MBR5588205.1 6,7-dimethyl-8-ribityllumazine synthase [Kiritimatiellia bacterium]
MKEITGDLTAKGVRLAIVVSRFNAIFTEQLLKGALDAAARHGIVTEDITVVRVPGANEIPLAAKRLAAAGGVDAVVALGAVIDGATDHAMLINTSVARALCQIGLDYGLPVLNGIVCAHSLDQAIERSGSKAGNKGFDTVVAAIETVNVLKQL